MNNKAIVMMTSVMTLLAAQACSSDDPTSASGSGNGTSSSSASGGGTSSSSASSGDTSSSSATGGGTSSSSASTGGATGCMSTLPASPPACPDTPTAEGVFESVKSACGLTKADLDFSDAKNPTLTATGKAKICSTCECQQKAFDYQAVYANCMDSIEAGNVALAKNIYSEAIACPK